MSPPVVLGREAEAELDEAVDRYERHAGSGKTFVAAVREVLTRLGRTPGLHAAAHDDIRCATVRRFPYGIYYRVRSDRVDVIAVVHSRRVPATWQERV